MHTGFISVGVVCGVVRSFYLCENQVDSQTFTGKTFGSKTLPLLRLETSSGEDVTFTQPRSRLAGLSPVHFRKDVEDVSADFQGFEQPNL